MTACVPNPSLKGQWFGEAQQFAAAYKAKYDYAPDYHAASGVADVETIVKAIEKADSLDPKKVRNAIAASNFKSLYGTIALGKNGQISLDQPVVQDQDGHTNPVLNGPEDRKSAGEG